MTLSQIPSALFTMPTAERETRLGEVFVRTSFLENCLENESIIIYGASGTGKTALRLLSQRLAPSNVITVPWLPEPVSYAVPGTTLAQVAMRQAIQALIEQLVQRPQVAERLQQAPDWTGRALAWFLQEYLPLNAQFYIESQGAYLPADVLRWYKDILQKPPSPIVKPDSTQNDQLRILVNLLAQAGFDYVWWLVDGLEKWPPYSAHTIQALVESLLSTLAIFDVPRLIFKVFAPQDLMEVFEKTSGVARYRLLPIKLSWDEKKLIALIETRLAVGFARPDFHLKQLCADPVFGTWLKQYGGNNPRTWINLVRPFVEQIEKTEELRPIQKLQEIARTYPPALRLFPERQEARLGEYIVSIDSADGFKILQYLHKHPGQICSLEEVYFCGIKGLQKLPASQDAGWMHKSLWRPALDTAIYRLRKKLEPDSGDPIYLLTHPRRGLELAYSAG